MTTAITLRRPTSADARRIANVQTLSWQRTYSPLVPEAQRTSFTLYERLATWEGILSESAARKATWLTESGGEVMGFIWSGPSFDRDASASWGEIHALHVHPDQHRRGLGRELLRLGIADLRQAGFQRLMLWVLEDNRPAQAFYTAQQWVPDGGAQRVPIGRVAGLPVVTELRFVYAGAL